MFNFVSFFALISVAVAAPGFVAETHVVQPVVTKVHTVPSAVSHQSFSQVHNNAHYVSPVVKTVVAAPEVHTYHHAAPAVVKTIATPVVQHTYHHATPAVVKTVATPVVHTYAAPAVQTYHVAPTVVKTVANPIVSHSVSQHGHAITHQSHEIHQKHAVITPVVKSFVAAPVIPVVHAAPVVKSIYVH